MRVLITGANRGLGLAFTRHYLETGDHVVATCRSPETAGDLQALLSDYPKTLTILPLDVADHASRITALEQVNQRWDGIDLFINNAGIKTGGSKMLYRIGELHTTNMERVFQVNAVAPLLLVECFLELIKGGDSPKVINISSLLGSISSKKRVFNYGYCASKAALNMITKMLSIELKPDGVIVVVMHPGHVRTDMGGIAAPLSPGESIEGMTRVIERLEINDTGNYLNWQGDEIPW